MTYSSYGEEPLDETEFNLEDLGAELEQLIPEATAQDPTSETQEPQEVEEEQKTNLDEIEPGEVIPGTWGFRKPRPGIGGFLQDTGRNLKENMAPVIGVADTITDAVNIAIPGERYDIPKITPFESKAAQAVRDVSGLIIPMLIFKQAAVTKGAAIHKAGVAPKGIQNLGNDRFFKWFAEAGIDIGTGAAVDVVAKQNERDDNLSGVLKKSFPKFFEWIPNSIATNDSDSPDLKRTKNVREGGILAVIASLVEGMIKIGTAGASLRRAGTKFIPENELASTNIKRLTTDEFTDVKFDDDPITDQFLRAQAREERALDELGRYQLAVDPEPVEPKLGAHDLFDTNETSIRPKDVDGLPGATVDAVRIQDNIDSTYGRLGAIIGDSARQLGLNTDELSGRALVRAVAKDLKDSGKYSAELASGTKITSRQIDDAGVRLAEILNDPRMKPGYMRAMLNEFKTATDKGLKTLNKKASQSIKKSIEFYKDEFFNMDMEKARAYLLTSEAGQISDIAEGARLASDTSAVPRAQDQILDRLQYLMVEKDLATFQNGLRRSHINTWKQAVETGDPEVMDQVSKGILNSIDEKLANIIPKTENYISTLRGIKDENPDFLKPFLLANELTDGNIDSMSKLHTFVQNKLGAFSKAVYDGKPEIPSILVRSKLGVLFNSILSSLATPVRALVGNVGGLIGKPASVFTGAILRGEGNVLRRAFHQYAGFTDSILKANEHMKVVYRKSATNPTKVSYVFRDDIALKEVQELDALRSYADASSKNGEDGANVLLSVWEENQKLAEHPWLRFGANSMTALDGFNRAMYATAEAKGSAFDAIMESGQEFTEEAFQKAADDIYESFFDKNGMIIDEAVEFATRESALNLDSNLTKGLSSALRRFPILRSVFMFPRTQANSIDIFKKWSPTDLALQPFHIFEGDYQKFTKYSWADYPESELKELLASKGIPFNNNAKIEFETKRAEYVGRVAIGTTTMIGAGTLAVQGRIRGNGHWDPQVQRGRRDLNWQAKTFQGWDGKWYSYEGLGPIGDLIALSADLVDNYDSISTGIMEKMQYKLAFILGASLTNRSFLSQMEPVTDMLSGNPAAWSRWSSQIANAWLPLAGLRGDLSKLINPAKREYNNEILDLIRNRNSFLDVFDPDGSLPYKYNWVSGSVIGQPLNMFARFNNTFSPIKVTDDTSPEEEFLFDIEYDSRPFFKTSEDGVEFNIHQRAELYSKVGEDGYFKAELKKIMKSASKLSYTDSSGKTYTGFRNIVKALRLGNISQEEFDHKEFGQIFYRIDQALRQATKLAEGSLAGTRRFPDLQDKGIIKAKQKYETQLGNVDEAVSLSEQYKQLQQQVQSR